MLPVYGKDRCRAVGDRIVLLSGIPKGWVARRPAAGTHAEYPGTAVEWGGGMYEVIEAAPAGAGDTVRYVLLPWREDHVIRTLERYDEEAERLRLEDFEKAALQRRASRISRWSGFALGHLPAPAQNRLRDEFGADPSRMTIASCVPPLVIFSICIWEIVGALLDHRETRIPTLVMVVAAMMTLESFIRFFVAMSQNRGIGSFIGTLFYIAWWALSPKRDKLASPFGEQGDRFAPHLNAGEAPDAEGDSIETFGALLSLLPRHDQELLATHSSYRYERHAFGPAWTILVFSLIGAYSVRNGDGASASISFLLASALAVEQIVRLVLLRRRPVTSVLGYVVRPFVQKLLTDVRARAGRASL